MHHRTAAGKAEPGDEVQVAMEAHKADRSVTEIAEKLGVHVTQVHR